MCYDAYRSVMIKETKHIYEICVRCMNKQPACTMVSSMCGFCVAYIKHTFPDLYKTVVGIHSLRSY